jgi:hypothetical protein
MFLISSRYHRLLLWEALQGLIVYKYLPVFAVLPAFFPLDTAETFKLRADPLSFGWSPTKPLAKSRDLVLLPLPCFDLVRSCFKTGHTGKLKSTLNPAARENDLHRYETKTAIISQVSSISLPWGCRAFLNHPATTIGRPAFSPFLTTQKPNSSLRVS